MRRGVQGPLPSKRVIHSLLVLVPQVHTESVDAAGMVLGIDQDLRGMGGGSQVVRVAQPAGGSAEEVAPGPMLVRRVVTITTTLHAVERVIP